MNIENIILKPAITEKGTYLIDNKKYLFYVNKFASKEEIAEAVKKIYKVDPIKINIISGKGKLKRNWKTRSYFKMSDYKKAIVQIKKDQKIQGFETAKE